MGSQIAGRPLVIPTANGNVTATPTAAGKVNLELNGKNETIEMAEFKEFLLTNAPKVNKGDTVAFSGEKEVVFNAPPKGTEEKSSNGLLKLLGLAAVTGVAIWQRKNIMKYAGKAWDFVTGKPNMKKILASDGTKTITSKGKKQVLNVVNGTIESITKENGKVVTNQNIINRWLAIHYK